MADTVFYSWQSDASERETRSLIREALQRAIAEVSSDLGLDDLLVFDQDTQGVPGNPEVAATILQKIDECGIFVADMTLVASTPEGKKSPNPNVLIEYGYALRSRGKSRLITVMNAFYGAQSELPFDLAYRRWPFSYSLGPEAPTPELRSVRDSLQKQLANAIRTIIESEELGRSGSQDPDWWASSVESPSTFLRDGDLIDVDRGSFDDEPPEEVKWMNRSQAFLRLIPARPLQLTRGNLDDAVRGLYPMSRGGVDVWRGRNPQGSTAYTRTPERRESAVEMLTQLFPTGEIWGIHQSFFQRPYIAMGTTQDIFRVSLNQYLTAASQNLKLALPYTVIAGLSGIMGREVVTSENRRVGYCMDDDLVLRVRVTDPAVDPDELLGPFYGMIWESAGVRPDDR